jgi:YggT family protein
MMIGALRDLLIVVLNLYTYVIIAAVIVSWLVGFGVINTYNQIARVVVRTLHALTEPVFGPIRRILPPFGGLDLSPLIALLLIFFLQRWLIRGTLV